MCCCHVMPSNYGVGANMSERLRTPVKVQQLSPIESEDGPYMSQKFLLLQIYVCLLRPNQGKYCAKSLVYFVQNADELDGTS